MHPGLIAAAGAATMVAALGLSGCAPQATTPVSTLPSSTPTAVPAPGPQEPALPEPGALTDVLYRLADPAVPGVQKLNLVQDATGDDAATLDRFAAALQDNGYTPPTFAADDIAWSAAVPVDVVATISVTKTDPGDGFSLPMEFKPFRGGWQLSKETFDMLLDSQPTP